MTLHRRSLNPPTSLADIAISALSGQGQYGAITQIAHDYSLSRQSACRLRDVGEQALLASFTPQPAPVWSADVPEATIKRSIAGLYCVAPCSMDDIVDLLPILFAGKTRSHGYIFNVLREAKENAADFLETVDLSPILAVAIDEMFWHQTPLFTGIDLDTGYLFSTEKTQRCSGPDVCAVASARGAGWLRAVHDRQIAQALALMHDHPEQRWIWEATITPTSSPRTCEPEMDRKRLIFNGGGSAER
ncbi:MAG: hypothetical protein ACI8S6_005672 [Myxococcota bacterium]|jgi:hypothetical protein